MVERSTGPLVAVVDDEAGVRTTVVRGLEKLGYRCHPFGGGQDLIEALSYLRFDAILLDLRMPEMDGMETLKAIPDTCQHIAVLIFTSHADIPIAVEAMKSGAEDFIEKPASLSKISQKIEQALKARMPLRENVQSRLLARQLLSKLTSREYEIMKLACDGFTSEQIAKSLGRSVRTVESHRHNAMKKLGEDRIIDVLKIFQVV